MSQAVLDYQGSRSGSSSESVHGKPSHEKENVDSEKGEGEQAVVSYGCDRASIDGHLFSRHPR